MNNPCLISHILSQAKLHLFVIITILTKITMNAVFLIFHNHIQKILDFIHLSILPLMHLKLDCGFNVKKNMEKKASS